MRLVKEILNLDRRLFVRWLHAFGSEAVLPAVIGVVVVAAQLDSAIQTGSVARTAGPTFADLLIDVYAATSYLVAIAAAAATGELGLRRQAQRTMTLAGVPRWHGFAAVQALSVGARHLSVIALCGLPAAALLWAIAEPARASVAIAGLVVLLITAPALGGLVASWIDRVQPMTMLITTAAAIIVVGAAQWANVPVLAMLPTHAVAQLLGGNIALGVAVIAGWTGLLLAASWIGWRTERGGPTMTSSTERTMPRISYVAATVAWIARSDAAVVQAEFLKLARWRRVAAAAVVGALFIALAMRFSLRSASLLPDVALALVPGVIVGGLFANVFAIDGAGAQQYYLAPISPLVVWRAKVASIAALGLMLELGAWVVSAALGNVPTFAGGVFIACCATAFLAWCAAVGGVLSTMFPKATDPRQFGEGLVAPEGILLWIPAIGMFVLIAAGLAFLHDSHRLPAGWLVVAGVVIAALAGFMLRVVDRVLRTLLRTRAERLTTTLAITHS